MRKIIYLFISIFFSSCTLSSSTDVEMNQRPTLKLNFGYLNSSEEDMFAEEVDDVNVFIYKKHALHTKLTTSSEELAKAGFIIPLYGVEEGDYNVITVTNTPMSHYYSNTDDIQKASVGMQDDLTSVNPIYFCDTTFNVRRGEPSTQLVNVEKRFNKFNISIEADSKLLPDISVLNVKIENVPLSMTFSGKRFFNKKSFTPIFSVAKRSNKLKGTFNLFDHDYNNSGEIVIYHNDSVLSSIPLSLIDSDKDDNFYDIKIIISALHSTIKINDWDIIELDNVNIGS